MSSTDASDPMRCIPIDPELLWTANPCSWCRVRLRCKDTVRESHSDVRVTESIMANTGGYTGPLEKVGPCQWKIPRTYRKDMRVDGLIFADDALIEQIKKDQGPEQVVNVATLPGIQKASLA